MRACCERALRQPRAARPHGGGRGRGPRGVRAREAAREGRRALTLADIDPAKRARSPSGSARRWADPSAALLAEVDVLAPCALGGAIDELNVSRLRCAGRVRRGEQHARPRRPGRRPRRARDPLRARLHRQRGRDHQHLGRARRPEGYDPREARRRVAGIEDTMDEVLDEAESSGVTPLAAADALARRRLGGRRPRLPSPEWQEPRTGAVPANLADLVGQHADGALHARGARLRRGADRQARGVQPGRQRQGQDRRRDDRGRRGGGPDRARVARRSSRRPPATPASRWRSSARRKGYRLELFMPQGMSRERENLLRLYGAARRDHRVARRDERGGGGGHAGWPPRAATASAPTSSRTRRTRRSTGARRPRRSGRSSTATSTRWWRASAPAARSPAAASASRSATPTCTSWRSSRSPPRCSPAALPGRTRSRGSARGSCPPVLNLDVVDEIVTVDDEDAIATARLASRTRGRARRHLGRRRAVRRRSRWGSRPEFAGKRIVVIMPDSGERYVSLPFFTP